MGRSCYNFQCKRLLGPGCVHSPGSLWLWITYVLDFLERSQFHFFHSQTICLNFWFSKYVHNRRSKEQKVRELTQWGVEAPGFPCSDAPSPHLAGEGYGSESTPGWEKFMQRERCLGNSSPLHSQTTPFSHPTREEFRFLQSSVIGQIELRLHWTLEIFCKQIEQLVDQALGSKVHTIK